MVKTLYKPLSLAISVIGGVLATALFKRVWTLVGHEDEAPSSTDRQRGLADILLAAVLQGAIFGLVKAVLDRGGAVGFRKATGVWPGDDG
jgi:Protein of unknown function (DUF4235)